MVRFKRSSRSKSLCMLLFSREGYITAICTVLPTSNATSQSKLWENVRVINNVYTYSCLIRSSMICWISTYSKKDVTDKINKYNQRLFNNQDLYLVTEKEKASQKIVIWFIPTDKNFVLCTNNWALFSIGGNRLNTSKTEFAYIFSPHGLLSICWITPTKVRMKTHPKKFF